MSMPKRSLAPKLFSFKTVVNDIILLIKFCTYYQFFLFKITRNMLVSNIHFNAYIPTICIHRST